MEKLSAELERRLQKRKNKENDFIQDTPPFDAEMFASLISSATTVPSLYSQSLPSSAIIVCYNLYLTDIVIKTNYLYRICLRILADNALSIS